MIENPYATIVAGIVGAIAIYFVDKVLKKWVQKYKDANQKKKDGELKEQARKDNDKANEEGDILRDIDESR